MQGNAADVQLLVDAGVNVNSGSALNDSAIYFAVFSGCGAKQGETDALVATVTTLLAAGADFKRKDDNGNTVLMSAAQMCGPRIVTELIGAGADINVTNGGGLNPLAMALIMHHPDAADALAQRGARLLGAGADGESYRDRRAFAGDHQARGDVTRAYRGGERTLRAARARRPALASQVLVEERQRARPRELRGRLVVARRRVVVEAVVASRVDERLVLHAVRLQRRPRTPASRR